MNPIPPTDAVSDPQVRSVLDALVSNMGVVRDSYVNADNVRSYTQEALVNILSGGAARDGTSLENIYQAIFSSSLYQKLTAPFSVALNNSKALGDLENRVSAAIGAQQVTAQGLVIEANTRIAAVKAEADARLAFEGVIGSRVTTIESVNDSQALLITGLTTRVSGAESTIVNLQSTTATQATSLTALTTRVGSAESNLSTLNTTTADQASAITALSTRVGASESSITNLQSTTATQATSLASLSTRVGASESNITSLNTTTSNQASSLSALTTRVSGTESSISTLNTTTAGQASSISSLTSRMGSAESAITNETTARTNADSALTSSVSGLSTRIGSAEAAITSEQSTRANKDNAVAAALNNIWAKMNGSGSAIDDGALAAVSPSAATATRWSSVVAAVTDPNTGQISSTSIRQELNSYANNVNNTLNSSYTLRINNNGYVSGFGLQSTTGAGSPGGSSSAFIILADSFSLVTPGENPVVPMTVSNGRAIFNGDLYAANGRFTGDVTGANGVFYGTLKAGLSALSEVIGTSLPKFTAANTYYVTVPAGITRMRVTLYGGGGGGHAGSNRSTDGYYAWESDDNGHYSYVFHPSGVSYGGGAAGKQGQLVVTTLTVTPGQVYTIIVGAGGAGGTGIGDGIHYQDPQAPSGQPTRVLLGGTVYVQANGGAGGLGPDTSGANGSGIAPLSNGVYPGGTGGGAGGGAGGITGNGGDGVGDGAGGGGGRGTNAIYDWMLQATIGGRGADGSAVIEFFDPNTVVLRTEFDSLKNQLIAQGHTLT